MLEVLVLTTSIQPLGIVTYTAIKMSDIYLSKKIVRLSEYQLVGGTCAYISCKVYKFPAPTLADFVYVTVGSTEGSITKRWS